MMKKTLALISLVLIIACNSYGEKLEYKNTEVYFTSKVTKEEAQRLGDYLVSSEFADGNSKSVQLTKSDNGNYAFRMVGTKEASENVSYEALFKIFGKQISDSVFNKAPVDFHICSNTFKTLKVIPFEK